MNISVFSIEKSQNKEIVSLCGEYIKMAKKYANIKNITKWNKKIVHAQTLGKTEAQKSYKEIYLPYLDSKNYNIALHVEGKKIDSFGFSNIFTQHTNICFFIGGAYGFEDQTLQKMNLKISLSDLTMAHKIAKIVLFEQIYRGLCIRANHPYHK